MSILPRLMPLHFCNARIINKLKNMKKLFLIPLMLLATLMIAEACSEKSPISDGQEQTAPVQATLVPDAVFEESLLLTSSTLGNMATRIPQWQESLGARNGECKRKI